MKTTYRALDFFAGSGLVTDGLAPHFDVVWANDICEKKQTVYRKNFPDHRLCGLSIEAVPGQDLPAADLAWASFPCQDLSLAGNMQGINNGKRSSLFYQWLRVLDEMPDTHRPPVLCAENVVGFLVSDEGRQFQLAYDELKKRGYRCGALVIDAVNFLPQSRPRSFLIAVSEDVDIDGLSWSSPESAYHTKAVQTAYRAVNDADWVWWRLPMTREPISSLSDICELDAPCDAPEKTKKLLSMLSDHNRNKLQEAKREGVLVGAGYKRVRTENGEKKQRFEVRFDGIAGCLRTPNGGSSRQILVLMNNGRVRTRLLTPRETARLMGAPEEYWLPDNYNEAYWAMGDAVAVPVTRWLAKNLLAPLSKRAKKTTHAKTSKCA